MAIRIGALAQLAQTQPATIRYYEDIGLLPRASRRSGGQRCYGADDVDRLTFIRRCRSLALPIADIRQLVRQDDDRGRACSQARTLAAGHIATLRRRIADLRALEAQLAGLIDNCAAATLDQPDRICGVLPDFYQPAPRAGRKPLALDTDTLAEGENDRNACD